jgi:hypothetical protein
MKNILDYSTFDQTEQAIEIWNITDPVDRACHKLSNSRQYQVYKSAIENRANIATNMNILSAITKDAEHFANHIPNDVGNV